MRALRLLFLPFPFSLPSLLSCLLPCVHGGSVEAEGVARRRRVKEEEEVGGLEMEDSVLHY